MEFNIDLSDVKELINPHFYPLLTDKNRYLVLYGGAGSGKSVFIAQKILIRVLVGMNTGIIHKFLCLRKTQPAIRKSVFALFRGLLSEWGLLRDDIVKVNQVEMAFRFVNGSEIVCVGLDDPEKLKSIYGITGVWMEECNEMNIDDFRQVNLRLRGHFNSYKQICVSFNPVSKLLWIYDEFFEHKKINATIHHSTYKDNLFLIKNDPEYVEELERYKEIDRTYYNIYTLGEWGSLLESIYSNYDFIDPFPEEVSFKDCAYGLDYGYNSPSACTFVGVKDENYYIKELFYDTKQTHQDLIVKLGGLIPLKHRTSRIIYCDSAEPELIKELNAHGFIAKMSDKSVKDGINYCKQNKLYLDSNSYHLTKEVPAYSYRKNNDGIVIDEPIKLRDHLCDAFRYAIYTHWGKLRPQAKLVFI